MRPDRIHPFAEPVTSAVVLAGGLGTRLRSVVPDLPKPMAPVAGVPFLARLLGHWGARGIEHVVLSVGYRHEVISDFFGSHWNGIDIDYAVEREPLGTGGGLRLALDHLDPQRRFVLLNGDTFFDVDLRRLWACALAADADWCFSLWRCETAGRYLGIDLDEAGVIRSFGTASRGARLVNGGVYLVHPRSLMSVPHSQRVSLEDDLFPAFASAGQRLVGHESAGRFIDIGVPEDYRRAADVIGPDATAEALLQSSKALAGACHPSGRRLA